MKGSVGWCFFVLLAYGEPHTRSNISKFRDSKSVGRRALYRERIGRQRLTEFERAGRIVPGCFFLNAASRKITSFSCNGLICGARASNRETRYCTVRECSAYFYLVHGSVRVKPLLAGTSVGADSFPSLSETWAKVGNPELLVRRLQGCKQQLLHIYGTTDPFPILEPRNPPID